jgi:hypothetical protein
MTDFRPISENRFLEDQAHSGFDTDEDDDRQEITKTKIFS